MGSGSGLRWGQGTACCLSLPNWLRNLRLVCVVGCGVWEQLGALAWSFGANDATDSEHRVLLTKEQTAGKAGQERADSANQLCPLPA